MSLLHTIKLTSKRIKYTALAVAFLATQLVVPLSASSLFGAKAGALDLRVQICHATNSTTNPYQQQTHPLASFLGHLSHTGPVWDASMDNGDDWGDIIPPFYVDGTPRVGPTINWNDAGKAIYYNDCNPVTSVTPQAPTATMPNCNDTTQTVTPPQQAGVIWSPASQTVLNPGDSVTYTATPASGYVFPPNVTTSFPFTNSFDTQQCQPQTGSIRITKNAVLNSTQDFEFTANGQGLAQTSFTLDDDNGAVGQDDVHDKTKLFTGLVAGDYTFSESDTDGWYLDGINCPGASITKQGASVTVHLAAGQNVECTYKNRQYSKIIVHKVTQPAGDQTNFTVHGFVGQQGEIVGSTTASLSTSSDAVFTVKQGSYAVNEDSTPGWTQVSSTCGNLDVTSAGQTVECTITNAKLASLKIVKQTNPGVSTAKFSFNPGDNLAADNFALDTNPLAIPQPSVPNSKTFTNLVPGQTYTVEELAQSGWKLTNLSCTGADYTWDGSRLLYITLPAGANVVCTFTNTKLGSISGIKFEVNALGLPVGTVSGVTIQLKKAGTVIQQTTTGNNGEYSFTDLLPDDYDVIEVLTNGWTQIYGDDSIHLSAGETEHNYFGNFKNATITGYKWNDHNGDGVKQAWEHKIPGWRMDLYKNGSYADSTWTNWQGNYTFNNLGPGVYKVCEAHHYGWSQTFPAFFDNCHDFIVFNSGDELTANFGNQARGTVTVTKQVVNDNGGKATAEDFMLKVNGQTVSSGDKNVFAAQRWYVVHEVNPSDQGYKQTDLVCRNQWGISLGKAFWLHPGERVSCTITNDDIAPQLTVIKQVDNGATTESKTAENFVMHVDGTNVSQPQFNGSSDGVTVTLDAGEFAVSEDADDSYTSSYSEDCNGTIAVGEVKVCTFTNTAIVKPAIHVTKEGPASAKRGQTVTYTFTVTNPGNVPIGSVTVSDDVAGDGAALVSGDLDSDNWLDPGEIWVYTLNYLVPNNAPNSITNTVTAKGFVGMLGEVNSLQNARRTFSLALLAAPQNLVASTTVVESSASHTMNVLKAGSVLGASTTDPDQLANTGQNALVSFIAAAIVVSLALATRWVGRKPQSTTL